LVVVRDQIMPEEERSSENWLHCEINDLVKEHIEGEEKVDLVALAAKMAESLVDLVLVAPEEEQARLLAVSIAHLGHTFLEKSGTIAGDANVPMHAPARAMRPGALWRYMAG
jgi:hypothetical protein